MGQIKLYRPDGNPLAIGKPKIDTYPTLSNDGGQTSFPAIRAGESFTLRGELFNGLSQAVSYGDDATMATNYPLVRLQVKGGNQVRYCRTFGHSWMGVSTNTELISTNFSVPTDVAAGTYELTVVANGTPSDPFEIVVVDQGAVNKVSKGK
ncbi:MAG TPA: hypothetical protein VLZ81_14275 [Blastocatellia bacterium]|nr:hypothetical protein [Blastocatellia bacterium]